MEADIAALSAAQAAALAAARPYVKDNGSSSSKQEADPKFTTLRHELDKAYLVACKVTEWREMIQVSLGGSALAGRVTVGSHT